MPTYVYRREDGTLFEVFQNITDPALTEDPETGQKVQRVITGGAGLQFKGSGFYLTDYARKGGGEKKEGGEGAAKDATSKASKGEAKASASEPKASKPTAKGED